ncbi:MAG: NYN domain-containing protein [Rubrivivax sp.]
MSQDRVMLLIDADNVSVDVMEQAVALLLEAHGAVHVRRAYGTAEAVVKSQAIFKRLSIRPMVNLSAGKNSTDIAMAVDAMDLVLSERPDIVVIVSSDSDFAPLVGRLREKGCRVLGIGQEGKTGDETQAAYDGYTVLAHRRSAGSAGSGTVAPRSRSTAAKRPPAARKVPAKRAAPAKAPSDSTASTGTSSATAKRPARKRASSRSGATAASAASTPAAASSATPSATPSPTPVSAAKASTADRDVHPSAPDPVQRILVVLPELANGAKLQLRVASERLRDAGLLSRSGSCTKLFGQHPDRFELTPAGQPNHVQLRERV